MPPSSSRALVYAGRLGETEELLTRAYALVVDEPAAAARAYVAYPLAVCRLEQGPPAERRSPGQRISHPFRQLGDTLQARWGYMSPRRLTMAGQADRAAGTLDALDASASRRIYRTTT